MSVARHNTVPLIHPLGRCYLGGALTAAMSSASVSAMFDAAPVSARILFARSLETGAITLKWSTPGTTKVLSGPERVGGCIRPELAGNLRRFNSAQASRSARAPQRTSSKSDA